MISDYGRPWKDRSKFGYEKTKQNKKIPAFLNLHDMVIKRCRRTKEKAPIQRKFTSYHLHRLPETSYFDSNSLTIPMVNEESTFLPNFACEEGKITQSCPLRY